MTTITGHQIAVFRAATLKAALKMEILGMKRQGPSAYSIIKSEFGYKGNKEKVLQQLEKFLEENK